MAGFSRAERDQTMLKKALSATGIVLTLVMFVPYIRSIHDGRTKPHLFSWIVWAIGTFTVFLAQLAGHGGWGAWPIGVSGLITVYIALLAAFKRTDQSITRSDWWFLGAALGALPCWFLTSNPLWAVVILTVVDLAGFGPTFRSAYQRPYDERMGFYAFAVIRNGVAIAALERYSLTTVLFPAAVGFACFVFVVMVFYRRRSPEISRPENRDR